MNRIEWNQVTEKNASRPLIRPSPAYLMMRGALDVDVHPEVPLDEKLFQFTQKIETEFRRSFPTLEITAEETQNTIWPEHPRFRYAGQIYGSNKLNPVVGIYPQCELPFHNFREEPIKPLFTAIFPLGEYHQNTKDALVGIWPTIFTFDFIFPDEVNPNIPAAPSIKRGNQAIYLIRNNEVVASGKYALEEAGIPVEMKPNYFISDGVTFA